MSLVGRGETLDDAQSNWARQRASGQSGERKGELVPDTGEVTKMARRARIMARRRRHIPPITDDNFHEEWNKFKMDLDASEDDIVYTFFAREQNSLLFLCRIWRLLLIREPPSDSEYTPRRINGVVVQSPQQLWDVGCRIYMTAVPDVFRAWRTEAEWRADWRGYITNSY